DRVGAHPRCRMCHRYVVAGAQCLAGFLNRIYRSPARHIHYCEFDVGCVHVFCSGCPPSTRLASATLAAPPCSRVTNDCDGGFAEMIEPVMYIGIGFLFAALIGVAVIPLVHDRAVRLTTRRLRAALPQSMKEIQADRDLLRAEFAMSTRRLEVNLEHLKDKSTSQVVELSKRDDAINRLKLQ